MKNLPLLLVLLLFAFSSCHNDEGYSPNDPLPAPTQTGAFMFACKVNGESYICKKSEIAAYYQWIQGGYSFVVRGMKESTFFIQTVNFANLGNAPIEEGQTYLLNGDNPGYLGCGDVLKGPNKVYSERTYTNSNYTGQLHITKFDIEDRIVSGTFWFDLKNPYTGEKIEIREGRFDTRFAM